MPNTKMLTPIVSKTGLGEIFPVEELLHEFSAISFLSMDNVTAL